MVWIYEQDESYRQLAVELAASVQGRTNPNPPVGAVIVKHGSIVGKGATQPPGGPHAEIVALQTAGDTARGAMMYVTLEPHAFHGHTPPCTDAIIAAGITAVSIAALDPNPQVNGKGVEQLRQAGIAVNIWDVHDSLTGKARELIVPFEWWLTHQTPLGYAKLAMSLDGKIATHAGQSQWITSQAARERGNAFRQMVDAILVGSTTAIADDPLLTTRHTSISFDQIKHPLRVVVDARGRMPLSLRMLQPDTPGATMIATTDRSAQTWRSEMAEHSVSVVIFPADHNGHVSLPHLWSFLGAQHIQRLLIEGGSEVLGSALAHNLIQRVFGYIAPIIIGGRSAPGPFGDPGFSTLDEAPSLHFDTVQHSGAEILFSASLSSFPAYSGEYW